MTDFDLRVAIPVLARTPQVLAALLSGLPDEWIFSNEGPATWSPFDVLGHLIHGERADWIPRVQIILEYGTTKPFDPVDRTAFSGRKARPLAELLAEFKELREGSLATLQAMGLTATQMGLTGLHPEFGEVTMRQLLATWVVHDLNHLAQVAQVMARQYRREVGPWRAYLPLLGVE